MFAEGRPGYEPQSEYTMVECKSLIPCSLFVNFENYLKTKKFSENIYIYQKKG
jgi:hypothetical protein